MRDISGGRTRRERKGTPPPGRRKPFAYNMHVNLAGDSRFSAARWTGVHATVCDNGASAASRAYDSMAGPIERTIIMDDTTKGQDVQLSAKEQREVSRIEELLKAEEYTPEEAAEVLNMRQRTIFSAVYGGELKAKMAGNDILSITRTELVAWLRKRQ
jgi:excisionase family DNA binding protein